MPLSSLQVQLSDHRAALVAAVLKGNNLQLEHFSRKYEAALVEVAAAEAGTNEPEAIGQFEMEAAYATQEVCATFQCSRC